MAKRPAPPLLLVIALVAAGLGACGNDDGSKSPSTPQMTAGEWTVFRPGGETTCARGTEYAYGVRGGTVNKVVIDFMGGGACWDELTCSFSGSLFNETVDPDNLEALSGTGIYDVDNPENPFRDWYHVFIPYCTGDVHWGDSVVSYGEGDSQFTIQHKGRTNAQTVLDWVYDNFSDPETVFVTGCSAGAYGSIGWAPHIMKHYESSKVYQMGDSGAGIITDDFFRQSFPSWNPEGIFPSFIPGLDPAKLDIFDFDLPYLYAQVANYFTKNTVSEYNSNFDENQTFFYSAMGGEGGQRAWSERMRANVDSAHAQAERFRSYIAPGELHCIIPYDQFYEYSSDGTRLVDWVSDLVDGKPLPARVACEGDDCGEPTQS